MIIKRRFLERELAWAQVAKREKTVNDLKNEIEKKDGEIQTIGNETKTIENTLMRQQTALNQAKNEWNTLFEERIALEREKAKHESRLTLYEQTLKETLLWSESRRTTMKDYLSKLEVMEHDTSPNTDPADFKTQLNQIKKIYEQTEEAWIQELINKSESLKQLMVESNQQLTVLENPISNAEAQMSNLDQEMSKISQTILDDKIRLALLQHQSESLQKTVAQLNEELGLITIELNKETKRAEEFGPQIVALKSSEETLDEIRLTDGHIAALADVSEDIERMYESYSKLYLELKEKAQLVAENREKALAEVKTRMESWRTVIQSLLEHVNIQYQVMLANAFAQGEVRLFNELDIEAAGLQIYVGFKGAKPVPLDAYTQSGGERSTATMMFLLALQQHVRSPFRAVDEYDIHMDPRNRETIAQMIVSSLSGSEAQYLVITPSQITFAQKDVRIITVQNLEGASIVKETH